MDVLDIARWQFGITTVYHFLMVPLTIGLSILVAGMETAWVRTGNRRYLKMTKFWGKLMMVNFAMGVATGITRGLTGGVGLIVFLAGAFGFMFAIEKTKNSAAGVPVLLAAAALTSAVPEIFDSVTPLLPLTPALEGMRAVAVGSGTGGGAAALLVAWLVVGLAAGVLATARRRTVRAPALVARTAG